MLDKLTLSDDTWHQVKTALITIQNSVNWKPGKDYEHLQTRQRYGHLPDTATLADYNDLIQQLVNSAEAELYIYVWRKDNIYPTVVARYQQKIWLVMLSLSGVIETAFPPTSPQEYLADTRFHYQGFLQEFLK